MSTKHTQGPWWRDDDGFIAAGSGDSYVTIADAHCSNDIDIDEAEANVNVIIAAPDMLSALRKAKAWMDPGLCLYENISEHDMNVYYETMEAINNAIQKATQP